MPVNTLAHNLLCKYNHNSSMSPRTSKALSKRIIGILGAEATVSLAAANFFAHGVVDDRNSKIIIVVRRKCDSTVFFAEQLNKEVWKEINKELEL